ncbi:MAG: arsenosugar biosynthesis radical SAM (seleno)protein ArsS [Nitrospirota bacterium]
MRFDEKIAGYAGGALRCTGIETIQVNLGLKCNQACLHCHVSASPERNETMQWPTMSLVLEAVRKARPKLVDLTGGAPEINPHFRRFVSALCDSGNAVQVRTNLTALLLPGNEDLPEFLASHGVRLAASMPCYLEENVRAQRGAGVYEDSITAIKKLNALGYGYSPELRLDLIYNPGGAYLPPTKGALEADYRRELSFRFGVVFSNLLTIANMPLGRFRSQLAGEKEREYMELLEGSFNPETLDGVMCRRQVSVGWDGQLYDCDFNLALGLPVAGDAPRTIADFDALKLACRSIATGPHCYGCTAGCGSSCRGALV